MKPGRSPHGERELKFSRPDLLADIRRRSPHGERELKYLQGVLQNLRIISRSPHGERELK